MEFNGERVVPGKVDQKLYLEHLVRYLFAAQSSTGKKVLDLGCGTGYGTHLLAENASRAVGLDSSGQAIEYARERYKRENLDFVAGDCGSVPFSDGEFGLVVSFEVIEHLEEHERFLSEAKRLLAPEGLFMVSTPNKKTYTDLRRGYRNPFHVKEFYLEEFRQVLGVHFPEVRIYAQFATGGNMVLKEPQAQGMGILSMSQSGGMALEEAGYFIAVCGNEKVRGGPDFLFLADDPESFRRREAEIRDLVANMRSNFEERTTWALGMKKDLDEKVELIGRLQAELRKSNDWAHGLEAKLQGEIRLSAEGAEAGSAPSEGLQELGKRLSDITRQCDERTQWALQMQQELEEKGALIRRLQANLEERNMWAIDLDSQIRRKDELIRKLQADIRELKKSGQ